jgi:hypothetical protein
MIEIFKDFLRVSGGMPGPTTVHDSVAYMGYVTNK